MPVNKHIDRKPEPVTCEVCTMPLILVGNYRVYSICAKCKRRLCPECVRWDRAGERWLCPECYRVACYIDIS